MLNRNKIKGLLMGATALAVAGGASAHAAAAAPEAAPTEMVAPVHHAADEAAQDAAPAASLARKAGIAALATAALAGLFHLLGGRRARAFVAAAAPKVAEAASAAARAPVKAAKAVARAAASPFRFLMLFAGLGLFALTGITVLDLEWAAGLMLGAAMAVLGLFGLRGLIPNRRRARVKVKQD